MAMLLVVTASVLHVVTDNPFSVVHTAGAFFGQALLPLFHIFVWQEKMKHLRSVSSLTLRNLTIVFSLHMLLRNL